MRVLALLMTLPLVGRESPAASRRIVDFPPPEGPTMAVNERGASESEILWRTDGMCTPYRNEASSRKSIVSSFISFEFESLRPSEERLPDQEIHERDKDHEECHGGQEKLGLRTGRSSDEDTADAE